MNGINELRVKHQYDVNLLNLKITQPSDINYSDDNLTYLPYFTYIWAAIQSGTHQLGSYFDIGLVRTMNIVRNVKSATWSVIFQAYLNHVAPGSVKHSQDWTFVMRDYFWQLQTWPLEQIDWPVFNDDRLDAVFDTSSLNRFNQSDFSSLFPYDEILYLNFNAEYALK